jgi:hypothetical protein
VKWHVLVPSINSESSLDIFYPGDIFHVLKLLWFSGLPHLKKLTLL